MDPSALQERKWTFGKVTARQSISVLGEGPKSYLYVCTTFSVPIGEHGWAHHARGSGVQFSDADTLTDDAGRQRLALEHMTTLAHELRLAANIFSVTLTERAAEEKERHLEGIATWMESTAGAAK